MSRYSARGANRYLSHPAGGKQELYPVTRVVAKGADLQYFSSRFIAGNAGGLRLANGLAASLLLAFVAVFILPGGLHARGVKVQACRLGISRIDAQHEGKE